MYCFRVYGSHSKRGLSFLIKELGYTFEVDKSIQIILTLSKMRSTQQEMNLLSLKPSSYLLE